MNVHQSTVALRAECGVPANRRGSTHSFMPSILRRMIGHGRKFMPTFVANRIGAAPRTVKGWLAGETDPHIRMLPALEAVLGEELVRELLAELGYAGAFKVSGPSIAPHMHATAVASALSELVKALADHRIDHLEAPKIAAIYRRLSSESARFAADLEAKRVA